MRYKNLVGLWSCARRPKRYLPNLRPLSFDRPIDSISLEIYGALYSEPWRALHLSPHALQPYSHWAYLENESSTVGQYRDETIKLSRVILFTFSELRLAYNPVKSQSSLTWQLACVSPSPYAYQEIKQPPSASDEPYTDHFESHNSFTTKPTNRLHRLISSECTLWTKKNLRLVDTNYITFGFDLLTTKLVVVLVLVVVPKFTTSYSTTTTSSSTTTRLVPVVGVVLVLWLSEYYY